MNTPRSHAACETCGSTDRVRPYGMDGTPLCWAHMLEANAKEDAHATPDRVAEPPSFALTREIMAIIAEGGPYVEAAIENACAHALREARHDPL